MAVLDSTDLAVIEQGVGTALWTYSPTPQGLSLGTVLNGLTKLVFDDSAPMDSLTEYVEDNNQKLEVLTDNVEELTEKVEESNDNIQALTEQISDLSGSIDSFISFQYFVFCTVFTILFVGYITRRVFRLFRWGSIKKGEGLM